MFSSIAITNIAVMKSTKSNLRMNVFLLMYEGCLHIYPQFDSGYSDRVSTPTSRPRTANMLTILNVCFIVNCLANEIQTMQSTY